MLFEARLHPLGFRFEEKRIIEEERKAKQQALEAEKREKARIVCSACLRLPAWELRSRGRALPGPD